MPRLKYPENVIKLEYPYYIKQLNGLNFAICELRGYKDKDNKDKDLILYYAGSLRDIIHVAINHKLNVSADVKVIMQKIDELHNMLDKKFPDVITAEVAEKWFKEGKSIAK